MTTLWSPNRAGSTSGFLPDLPRWMTACICRSFSGSGKRFRPPFVDEKPGASRVFCHDSGRMTQFKGMNREKIKLGISSCLMGNSVRYDGGHKLDPYLRHTLGQFIEWVPICPEAECGLPVPREAMDLVGDPGAPRLVTRVTGVDHTGRMLHWAKKKMAALEKEDLCGFVFKTRSPSSGMIRSSIPPEGMPVSTGRYFREGVSGPLPPLARRGRGRAARPGAQGEFH